MNYLPDLLVITAGFLAAPSWYGPLTKLSSWRPAIALIIGVTGTCLGLMEY